MQSRENSLVSTVQNGTPYAAPQQRRMLIMERAGKLVGSNGAVPGCRPAPNGRGDLAGGSIQARQEGAGRVRMLAKFVAENNASGAVSLPGAA